MYTTPPPPGQTCRRPDHSATKAPLYRRQDFGGTIGGPLYIPGVFNTRKDKTFFFFSEEFRLEKTPTEYNQAVPGLKERGLILTRQGVQKNLQTSPRRESFIRTSISATCARSVAAPAHFPCAVSGLPSHPPGRTASTLFPITSWKCRSTWQQSTFGVDKNAMAILNSNLIPLPNAPFGCNFSLANFNPASPDPSDPNHCYDAAVSPSTYWREELFRIDQTLTNKVRSCRFATFTTPGIRRADAAVGNRAELHSPPCRTASLGRAQAWWRD